MVHVTYREQLEECNERCFAEIQANAQFKARAEAAEARLAILDAQEVGLPEPKYEQSDWDYSAAAGKQRPYKNESSMKCELAIAWAGVHMRQRQFLDALRAVKASSEALNGLLHRHADGTDERYWAEWDAAISILKQNRAAELR